MQLSPDENFEALASKLFRQVSAVEAVDDNVLHLTDDVAEKAAVVEDLQEVGDQPVAALNGEEGKVGLKVFEGKRPNFFG